MPDAIGQSLASVMARLEALENQLHQREFESGGGNGNGNNHKSSHILEHPALVHTPDHGVWRGEDFSI